MNLIYTIKIALGNLTTFKLRTVLAMLGVLVGTASVVAMVSSGQLATAQALAQFKALGTDLLAVSIYSQSSGSSVKATKLSLKNAKKMSQVTPDIITLAPYTTLFAPISFEGKQLSGGIVGITHTLQNVIKIKLAAGRFISFLDGESYYCVLGNNLYNKIKNQVIGSPIGKQILLGKIYFTIIGIAKPWPQNTFFNQDVNDSVFIPIETAGILSKYAQINNIVLRLKKGANISQVEKQISAYINEFAPGNKLFFRSAKELIKSLEKQKQILTIFLGLIGSVSLVVGGIGVMNIMLVSVIERRREIGIRRAIGAKRRNIQMMFLIEAVMLSLVGGLLGVIVGIATSFIIADYAKWHFTVFLLPPLIGFTVSVLIGIFFGFYPAYSASRLDPIQTLRAE